MPTAEKLPSGSWRCRAYKNGVSKSFTASSKKEAELLAIRWQNQRTVAEIRKTVGDCCLEYIESKRNVLSPTTIAGYEKIYRNWMDSIRDIPIKQIDDETVQLWVNKLSLRYSPKTVRHAHGFLTAILRTYSPETYIKTSLPAKQKKIKQLPDLEKVMRAIIGSSIELECLLALWCGMRMSEIRGLSKDDISGNVATIRNTVVTVGNQHIEKKNTKTFDSTRIIVLPERIIRLIDALPDNQSKITMLSGQAIYKRFSRLLEASGIKHMTFHDLRHMNASVMVALGVPDKYAMERGGWSSTSIMKSVYQHTITAERRKFDGIIDDFFETTCHDICHKKK